MFALFRTGLAANADNVSDAMAIATAGEALLSLVRSAVASAHVIPLVPDLSLAGGIGHGPVLTVPIMVVPRPDLKLCSTIGLEEHRLGSKGASSPFNDVTVQSSFSKMVTALR